MLCYTTEEVLILCAFLHCIVQLRYLRNRRMFCNLTYKWLYLRVI